MLAPFLATQRRLIRGCAPFGNLNQEECNNEDGKSAF